MRGRERTASVARNDRKAGDKVLDGNGVLDGDGVLDDSRVLDDNGTGGDKGRSDSRTTRKPILVELDHVSKVYGDLHAVDDLSITVPQGQWLSIVGSSGSGKTTLMNIIGCMDTPTSGSVSIDGRRLEDLTSAQLAGVRKNVVGLVFQKFHLVPHLTAVENVMVAQYYHSVVDEREAMRALEEVGLGDRARHLPRQLSGGEQQRVCVARALINSPRVILADEPTGNLDEANEAIVLDLFRRLHKGGTTIIVVTHDATVASCSEREIMLNHGVLAGERWNDESARKEYERAGGRPASSGSARETAQERVDSDGATHDGATHDGAIHGGTTHGGTTHGGTTPGRSDGFVSPAKAGKVDISKDFASDGHAEGGR